MDIHKETVMYMTAEEAMRRMGCNRQMAITVFRELDRAGIARFVRGRRGYPTRIETRED